MKILYIANALADAQVAASALRGIAPNVSVLWAAHLDRATEWIRENGDLAALVMEAQVDGQGCTAFLKHVRSLGLRAPVVVIAPVEAAPRLESLEPGAYDFVEKNDSLALNLRVVVARAIERAQSGGHRDTAPVEGAVEGPRHHERRFTVPIEQERGGRAVMTGTLVAPDVERQDADQRPAPESTGSASPSSEPRAEYDVRLATAEAGRDVLAQTPAATPSPGHAAPARSADEAADHSAAAERQAALEGLLRQERAARADLEQKLVQAEAALHDAEERHRSAMATAAKQLAERQAQYEVTVARAAATWEMVDEQVREAGAEVEGARQRQAAAVAEADRLVRRESELSAQLADATWTHATLTARLADAEAAREAANERTMRERTAAAEQAAERQTALRTELEQELEKRKSVEEALARAVAARNEAEERHAAAVAAADARLAERQARFDAELSEAATTRTTLAQQLSDLEAALARARQDLEAHAAAADRFTEREVEIASTLAEATATRQALERRLAATEAAFKDADERATRERLAATRKAAAREAELDGLIRQEQATRATLEEQAAQADAVLRDAEQRHAAAIATATTELARREIELAETAAARRALERQLSDAAAAMKDVDERAAREWADATARQADLETRLVQERTARETVEGELVQARTAAADAERWFREESAAIAARAREDAAQLENQFARERLEHEHRLSESQEQLRRLALERDALDTSIRTIQEQSARLDAEHQEEREALERARRAADADVQRLTAEHAQARQTLEDARRNVQQALDRVSSEHADALAMMATVVIERDVQAQQVARHSASLQAAANERAQLQDGFQRTLAARNREIEQLQHELEATTQELHGARTRRDALQAEADRLPLLQEQLDEALTEMRRQFERVPLALFRCTPGGALTHANPAFEALVGPRKAERLRSANFAAALFESPDDLSWLIERCLSTRAAESVETGWRIRNEGRLVVRLTAIASTPEVIEIVAEDVTNLHALEQRLGQAYRMEAVGRLASEVAVTCGNLLRDVHQDAQQWLMTVGGDTALRHQGELLLDEVTRAAGFLRQLASYSEEETSALAPVDLHRVLRGLEPILKRVAGDQVEVEIPKASSRLDVDVRAERVERLLVNLAGYGRERMPSGGRLKVEVATVVVDLRFVAKHPTIRQGPHALITVTGVRHTAPAEGLLDTPTDAGAGAGADKVALGGPGVDLGALQALIRECSGHLWMTIEPRGDMIVKVHLPLLASSDRTPARASVVKNGAGRAMARWFQP